MMTKLNADGFETFTHNPMSFDEHDKTFKTKVVYTSESGVAVEQAFIRVNEETTKIVYFVGDEQFKDFMAACKSVA